MKLNINRHACHRKNQFAKGAARWRVALAARNSESYVCRVVEKSLNSTVEDICVLKIIRLLLKV